MPLHFPDSLDWVFAGLGDGSASHGDVSAIRHWDRNRYLGRCYGPNATTVPFASIGWDVVLREWQFGIAAGVCYRTRSAQDRPELNSPALDGVAYVLGIQRNPGVEPMVQFRIAYQQERSPWTFQLTGLWISEAPQNHWWGVGVKYDAW